MLAHTHQIESQECRREESRRRQISSAVAYWSDFDSKPRRISAIEVDQRGARLLLPQGVRNGDLINVSFADELGHYRSYQARVAWTQRLEIVGKVVAGVMFLGETGILGRSLGLAGLNDRSLFVREQEEKNPWRRTAA